MDDPLQRQQILADFKRRRIREIVSIVPLAVSILVIEELFDNPELEIAGLTGFPLLVGTLGLLAAVLIHHIANWRCPVCNHAFLTGITVSHCNHCGTLFTEPKGTLPGGDPVAEHRERAELAVKAEVEQYQSKYTLNLVRGLGIFLLGCTTFLFLAIDTGDVRPDSWLYQRFGERGVFYGTMMLGGAILLFGLAVMAHAIHRIKVGSRRYEEEVRRQFLEG